MSFIGHASQSPCHTASARSGGGGGGRGAGGRGEEGGVGIRLPWGIARSVKRESKCYSEI